MSVRKPTSKDKTGEFSSVAEKIKALKERASKLNPFSPVRKKLQKQIQNLKKSPTSVSPKLIGSGKTIGVNKTKTGQYKEKTPEVKTPFFKLKDDPSKRLREKRLALEKANREKVRLAKGRAAAKKKSKPYADQKDKSPATGVVSKPKRTDIKTYPIKSETSTDDAKTHMIRLKAQGKNAAVTGDERGSTVVVRPGSLGQDAINRAKAALARRTKKKPARTFKDPYKGQVKKPATGVVSKPKKKPARTFKDPYKGQVKKPATGVVTAAKKKPVSKVTDKPKTKDMSVWETIKQGYKNLQADPRSRSRQVQEATAAALNKKMTEAPASVKRMKEYKQIGDMLKARQAKPTGKDIASGRDAEARRKAAKLKRQAALKKLSPVEQSAKTYGGELTPKKVVKKQPPKKLAKIIPRRKPTAKKDMTPAELNQFKQAKAPVSLGSAKTYGGELTSKGTGAGKMGGRPEDRSQRKDYDHFLRSKGGIEGFQRNLFGKNKTVAEASKEAKEAYDREQIDRKRPGQSDFYQYGEGRRSQLKKGGRVGKKKQGYKARKDESIAMRVKKKRTKKQLKVSRSDSYGKFGKGKGKGKINRSGVALVAASYD
jgi:hypothetical protein